MALREVGSGTDRERAENETQFADHLLSTENEWADLEGGEEARRLHYSEHQLQFRDDYTGPAREFNIPPEEWRELLSQLLEWTGVCSHWHWPLPPRGLPGFLHSGYDQYSPEGQLLELGIRYVRAVVNNERRAMHNRWNDAADMIRKIEERAEERVYAERAKEAVAEWERQEATPQFVYFIGAEGGPVKIGIATNAQNRLKTLQTSHHERLSILAVCDGGPQIERAYHKRFADHRLSGEWFERCPEIEAEIERLNHA